MNVGELLAAINAGLNALSFALLVSGFIAVRAGRRELHRTLMVAAFGASSLFLASYLTRLALAGTTEFRGVGLLRTVYLTVLFTHMLLAIAVVPMCFRALYLAWRQRFAEHRRVTRWLFPIWTYVSFTGVVVYLMLYQLPAGQPASQAASAVEAVGTQ